MSRVLMLAAFFLLSSAAARGTCTGSATTWSCTAGSTSSDVQTAINNSSDGATITFAAGSYSLSGAYFSLSHGTTLICATPPLATGAATTNPCTITSTGVVFGTTAAASNNTHFYRISGFQFTVNGGTPIWFCSAGGCNGSFSQVRIDHNTINFTAGSGSWGIVFGDSTSQVTAFGVIDHNIFNSPTSFIFVFLLSALGTPQTPPMGQSNNMFIENNTINEATLTDPGTACIDGWGNAFSVVYRYNTSSNCRVVSHGSPHAGGPGNFEVYKNSITMNANAGSETGCYRCIHTQGGNTFLAFSNALTAAGTKDSDPIAFLHYRDDGVQPTGSTGFPGGPPPACDGTVSNTVWPGSSPSFTFSDGNRAPASTWFGYPCYHQPGRDLTGAYKPIYAWNNYWSDTLAQIPLTFDDPWTGHAPPCTAGVGGNCDYSAIHIVNNREYFNAASASAQSSPTAPFNGTTGMGFGTLANRPATCTTSTETAFGKGAAGVGYFATDVGAQGTLYTCSATNTWSVYYTPYTYPHPLVNGTGSSGPAPPTGLAAIVQ